MFNWFRKKASTVNYPSPHEWGLGTPQQIARTERIFAELQKRQVPVYGGPLFADEEEGLQSAQNVARRAIVILAVASIAEGAPRDKTHEMLSELELWPYVSPDEKEFLLDEDPHENYCQQLVWRLESLWTLAWALGLIKELSWPSDTCNVAILMKLIGRNQCSQAFIELAHLRPSEEILDAQELIVRIHWAIRDASLNHDTLVPQELDWTTKSEHVYAGAVAGVGVVEQRHHTLNWITNFCSPENWDEVDTPT